MPEVTPNSWEQGMDLLYDVELEATLRFGARELPLYEVLEIGARGCCAAGSSCYGSSGPTDRR